MTEHLPECPMSTKDAICCSIACICDALRTCEARVHEAAYQAGKAYGLTVNGYTRGLDAAREALFEAKAIDVYYGRGLDEPPQFIWLNNALSAIDALTKEEQP